MRWILALLIVTAVFMLTFFRFAPDDVALAHTSSYPQEPGDFPRKGGFGATRRITTTPEGILKALDQVALATPRTQRLAGDVDAGIITYVTRSAVFGFPDYTTAEITTSIADVGPLLQINGRQRFGIEDLGVNEARIKDWLGQLGPLIVAP